MKNNDKNKYREYEFWIANCNYFNKLLLWQISSWKVKSLSVMIANHNIFHRIKKQIELQCNYALLWKSFWI